MYKDWVCSNFSQFSIYFAVTKNLINPGLCSLYLSKRDNYQNHLIPYTKLKNTQDQQNIVAAVALSACYLSHDKSQPGHKLYETGPYSSYEIMSQSGPSNPEEMQNCSKLWLLRSNISQWNEAENRMRTRNVILGWNILQHIHAFLGSVGEKSEGVRESEREWNRVVLALLNLVGTLFLASSELNKAQKQIIKDLKGPTCFSKQSLFRFRCWYSKYVRTINVHGKDNVKPLYKAFSKSTISI